MVCNRDAGLGEVAHPGSESEQHQACVPVSLQGRFMPQADSRQPPAAARPQGIRRQPCSARVCESCEGGAQCCSFSMTVTDLPLSRPPTDSSSAEVQPSWWYGWFSSSLPTPPAHVSVTIAAKVAACHDQHSGSVRIKLHRLSSSISAIGDSPSGTSLGAILQYARLQFDVRLHGVPWRPYVDPDVNYGSGSIASRAAAGSNRLGQMVSQDQTDATGNPSITVMSDGSVEEAAPVVPAAGSGEKLALQNAISPAVVTLMRSQTPVVPSAEQVTLEMRRAAVCSQLMVPREHMVSMEFQAENKPVQLILPVPCAAQLQNEGTAPLQIVCRASIGIAVPQRKRINAPAQGGWPVDEAIAYQLPVGFDGRIIMDG